MAKAPDNRGFTYLTVLFMVAILGLALASTGKVYSQAAHREKEEELLFRGGQIRKAIGRYYDESPGAKAYPKNLEELVKDNRWPVPKRHLRRLYTDPLTGKADWEFVKSPDGAGIMGVKSKSAKETIKRKNFPQELASLEGKTRYNEWEFNYTPVSSTSTASATTGASSTSQSSNQDMGK